MSVLHNLQRDALIACVIMSVVASVVSDQGWRAGLAVWGGGALASASYWGLKAGVYAGVEAGWRRAIPLVKFFTRYAILAFAAYVMLARLRLHPLGVVAGASSFVVAVGAAAVRALAASRARNPH